jgi:ketosteroid isomerase-like protein
MRRFNNAFLQHDPAALADLVADDCVMEGMQPAPNGLRCEGRAACLEFWEALASDSTTWFELEDVVVAGDRATIRWRYHFGEGEAGSVRGVNLMQVRDGLIVEALGYAKTP